MCSALEEARMCSALDGFKNTKFMHVNVSLVGGKKGKTFGINLHGQKMVLNWPSLSYLKHCILALPNKEIGNGGRHLGISLTKKKGKSTKQPSNF